MNYNQLTQNIINKQSFLCVGIDPDENLIPTHLKEDKIKGVYDFCTSIIKVTAPHCVAFKINFAFFESFGLEGWELIVKISNFIKDKFPNHFLIADAKRGDIGNTSTKYASGILDKMGFDAITVSPYMGEDSIKPFFIEDKWVIILMLTSNNGSSNFQKLITESGDPLYLEVGKQSSKWGDIKNTMFVVGGTHPNELKIIRERFPEHFFLIPGFGKQGGSLQEISDSALNNSIGILVNSSRGIIHASSDTDYLDKTIQEVQKVHQEMTVILKKKFDSN